MSTLHRYPLTSFFVLAYLLSWAAIGAGIGLADPAEPLHGLRGYILLASFGPAVAALLMLATGPEPSRAIVAWLKVIVRFRAHPIVYLIAILLPAVVVTLVMTIFGIVPLVSHPASLVYLTMLGLAPLNGLANVFVGVGPLGEEPGWRGYALPRMLARKGIIRQSIILGTLWAAWHLPVIIAVPDWRNNLSVIEFIPVYWVGVTAAAYVVTYIWIWSRGSVFLAIWFHGLVNFIGSYAFAREIWNVADYSDLQLAALQTLSFVLTALVVGLIARTRFADTHSRWLNDSKGLTQTELKK